jgi:predicted CoA-binding protein
MKKTLVIGASENPSRYSNVAIRMLKDYGHPVEAVGLRPGMVGEVPIQTGSPDFNALDTVTLYLGPQNQPARYNYILGLKPKRVIFNPGTENPEFETLLNENGIETEEACTLVLLRTGQY